MKKSLNDKFVSAWQAIARDGMLPSLADVKPWLLSDYDGYEVIFKLQDGDIIYTHAGPRIQAVLQDGLIGQSFTFLYPEKLKQVEQTFLEICFHQKIGTRRLARYLFGHRHRDMEWLLLPVEDTETGVVLLAGLAVPLKETDKRDQVALGSDVVERIIIQNYLSLGKRVDLNPIQGKAWAFLGTMGTTLAVDGEEIDIGRADIMGDIALAGVKAARPNVLAVASVAALSSTILRLAGRYNLKIVETMGEAIDILVNDKVDVLITDEKIQGGDGLELISTAKSVSPYTGYIMMLNARDYAENEILETESGTVHCLIKPAGEFTIRQAIDDTNLRQIGMLQRDALSA